MNNKTVIGAEQCCSDHVSCKRIEMTVGGLLPEYRALLEEAEKKAADIVSFAVDLQAENVKALVAERDALKANLEEAMALLTRVHGMFEALDHTHYSDKQFRKWEALNERITALRERIGK